MNSSDAGAEEFLEQLEGATCLRYLNLHVSGQPFFSADGNVISQECLAAAGKLAQLEELRLGGPIESGGLACVAGLANLKTLSLQLAWVDGEQDTEEPDRGSGIPLLATLPELPRLEAIDLRPARVYMGGPQPFVVGAQGFRRLSILPRLRSLNLSDADVTDAGVVELTSLESLEELAIADDMTTPGRLQALCALKRLKALHIQRYAAVTEATLAELPNQVFLQERQFAEEATMSDEVTKSDQDVTSDEEATPDESTAQDEAPMPDQEAMPEQKAVSAQEPISKAGRRLLHALRWLKESRIAQHGSYDESDRLTTLTLDHGNRIFALESELDALKRAFDALRQANRGIVIDSDPKWFDKDRGKKRPPR